MLLLLASACGGRTDFHDYLETLDHGEDGTGGQLAAGAGGDQLATGGAPFGAGGVSIGTGGMATGGVPLTGGTGGRATGGTGGTGGSGGDPGSGGASGGTGGSGGSPSVSGDVFVDCETTIENGDGFSWATPLKHPALAIEGREDGDIIYLKAGTCRAWHDVSEPLLTIPSGLSVTLAGGYDGNNLNDEFAHSGGRTVLSGDKNGDDVGLPPADTRPGEFNDSRLDNNRTILLIESGATVAADSVTVSGSFSGESEESHGCVTIETDAHLALHGSTIRNCATPYSAALSASPGSSVEFVSVEIESNHSFGGLGVVTLSGAGLQITGGTFRSNLAVAGGAVGLEDSYLEGTGLLFENNRAHAQGGALHLSNELSSATLIDADFIGNSTSALGGAISNVEGSLYLFSSSLSNSTAAGPGGFLFISGGTTTIEETEFLGGTAWQGGHISMVSDAEVALDSCRFFDGAAESGGGFISATSSTALDITSSWFVGGTAETGGQLSLEGTHVTIESSHFIGASAEQAGSFQISPNSVVTISDSTVSGSTAQGTASVLVAVPPSDLSIESSAFVGNGTAGIPLILAYSDGDRSISGSVFRDNVGQGVVSVVASTMNLSDSYIGTHTSGGTGVLSVGGGATLNAVGLTLAENSSNGAATPVLTVNDGGTLSLRNTVVWASGTATEPWISLGTLGISATGSANCGPAQLSTFGTNTLLTGSPFVDLGAHTPHFQRTDSPCLDQGADTGFDYGTHSVVSPFTADGGATDPGYHFSPPTPMTRELTVSAGQVSWNVDTTGCALVVPHESLLLGVGASGTYDHALPAGTPFYFVCYDSSPDTPPVVLAGAF